MKKWPHIDFLRLDKYSMLVNTVLKKYLSECYENKHYDMIFEVLDYISMSNHSGYYNYNFISNVLLTISQFISDINISNIEFYEKLIMGSLKVYILLSSFSKT
jgi:hypothetical protein